MEEIVKVPPATGVEFMLEMAKKKEQGFGSLENEN